MFDVHSRRRPLAGAVSLLPALLITAIALGPGAAVGEAATKPEIAAVWVTEVVATSARLRAEINPEAARTTYHFNYISATAYEANVKAGREGFAGAVKVPAGADPSAGEGTAKVMVYQSIGNLIPENSYRYRLQATNAAGIETSATYAFTTQGLGGGTFLADQRGWEMVSPIDKNGGQIQAAGQIHSGGILQAAADGNSITYSSTASFGQGAEGAPDASQYISRRSSSGWSTQNITTPMLSGSYGENPNGVPYQLFSPDLNRGLLLNGLHCRQEEPAPCSVANPSLPGTEAPAGYENYYLRNNETGTYAALLTHQNSPSLTESADLFNLALAGTTPDLKHVIVSTCAKLTQEATEVSTPEGCELGGKNLYEYSEGKLRLINILPGQSQGTPGAYLAAQSGAVSADGSRVYFGELEDGPLYLREGTNTYQVSAGPGAAFQTATPDGTVAFYIEGGHLYSYAVASHTATDLTPTGGVAGVLGTSEDGSYVYYALSSGALYLWHAGGATEVASSAQASDWPPATGTARVSADGTTLLFLSKGSLTGYDNTDQKTGMPDSEVFLYITGASHVSCLSCNPTGARPLGPSQIPGAIANGDPARALAGEIVTDSYKPRTLSANGRRVFFESADGLVLQDTDNAPDVYEWEAQGEGTCATAGGCLSAISSGRAGATFADASATGSDVFFITEGQLVPGDPGSADLYDAREGGGFPEPPSPISCQGDACQTLPPEPEDPEPGTLRENPGNPPLKLPEAKKCRKRHHLRNGHCVKNPKNKHKKRGRRARR